MTNRNNMTKQTLCTINNDKQKQRDKHQRMHRLATEMASDIRRTQMTQMTQCPL